MNPTIESPKDYLNNRIAYLQRSLNYLKGQLIGVERSVKEKSAELKTLRAMLGNEASGESQPPAVQEQATTFLQTFTKPPLPTKPATREKLT